MPDTFKASQDPLKNTTMIPTKNNIKSHSIFCLSSHGTLEGGIDATSQGEINFRLT